MENIIRSGMHDFDFTLKPMINCNRRRTNAMYPEKEGVWEEFEASHTGEKYLDGKVIIDHFEGTFPDGEVRKDDDTRLWRGNAAMVVGMAR